MNFSPQVLIGNYKTLTFFHYLINNNIEKETSKEKKHGITGSGTETVITSMIDLLL